MIQCSDLILVYVLKFLIDSEMEHSPVLLSQLTCGITIILSKSKHAKYSEVAENSL